MGARTGSRELALRALLVVASGLFVLLVGEAVSRLFFPDERLRYVLDDGALYFFQPEQVGILHFAGGGPSPTYRINRFGFRGPETGPEPSRRILLLGDSFTFGQGVQEQDTFAARLDRALGRDVAVVNAGQPGYGVFQMQATLERVGPELRPELVGLILWQGDLLRQPPSDAERRRLSHRHRLFGLIKTSVFVTHVYRRLEDLAWRFGADPLAARVGEIHPPDAEDPQGVLTAYLRGWEADVTRLRTIDARARAWGQGLWLSLWPKEGFAPRAEPGLAQRLEEEIRGFGAASGVPVESLRPAFASHRASGLMIPRDGHPTALAHCLVARQLLAGLESFGYQPAEPIRCGPQLQSRDARAILTTWMGRRAPR